jgi:hypothetical protein
MLSLGYTKDRLAKLGRTMPEHLHLQLDNTCSQNKNSFVLKTLVAMVALRMWVSASLGFLRVGHTHEDVGNQLTATSELKGFITCPMFTKYVYPMFTKDSLRAQCLPNSLRAQCLHYVYTIVSQI